MSGSTRPTAAIGVARVPEARAGSRSRATRRRSADARKVAPGTTASAAGPGPATTAASSRAIAYWRAAPVRATT